MQGLLPSVLVENEFENLAIVAREVDIDTLPQVVRKLLESTPVTVEQNHYHYLAPPGGDDLFPDTVHAQHLAGERQLPGHRQ